MKTIKTIATSLMYVRLQSTVVRDDNTGLALLDADGKIVTKNDSWRFGFADELPAIGKEFVETTTKVIDVPIARAKALVYGVDGRFAYLANLNADTASLYLRGSKVSIDCVEYTEKDTYTTKDGEEKAYAGRCIRYDIKDVKISDAINARLQEVENRAFDAQLKAIDAKAIGE